MLPQCFNPPFSYTSVLSTHAIFTADPKVNVCTTYGPISHYGE